MTTVNLLNPFWTAAGSESWRMRVVSCQDRWTGFDCIQFKETIGGPDIAAGNTVISFQRTIAHPDDALWDIDKIFNGFDNLFISDGVEATVLSDWYQNERAAGVQFPEPKNIREFSIQAGPSAGDRPGCPSAFLVQRLDGSTWKNRAYYNGPIFTSAETRTISVSATDLPGGRANACFFRLRVNGVVGGASGGLEICEIEMRLTPGGVDQCNGGWPMASRIGAGGTANGTRFSAFRDDGASTWVSNGGNYPYDLGYAFPTAPGGFSGGELALQIRGTSVAPTDFQFDWSDDLETWNTLFTVTGETWSAPNQIKLYAIP